MPAAQVQHGGGERIRVGAPDDAGQAGAGAAVSACGQRVGDVDGVGHAVRHCARAVHVPADGSAHCLLMVVICVFSACSLCSLSVYVVYVCCYVLLLVVICVICVVIVVLVAEYRVYLLLCVCCWWLDVCSPVGCVVLLYEYLVYCC